MTGAMTIATLSEVRRKTVQQFEASSFAWEDVKKSKAEIEHAVAFVSEHSSDMARMRQSSGVKYKDIIAAQQKVEHAAEQFRKANAAHDAQVKAFMELNLSLFKATAEALSNAEDRIKELEQVVELQDANTGSLIFRFAAMAILPGASILFAWAIGLL